MEENQRQPLLRSINNRLKSFVRFVNKTPYNVQLYWIDYQGQAISYGVLSRSDIKDIDTFVTHPWIAVDAETRDRYVVNHKDVFFPEPWYYRYRELRRDQIPLRIERECVNITLPMCTLRELSMRAIKKCLRYDRQAFSLNIPRSLQYELARKLPKVVEER